MALIEKFMVVASEHPIGSTDVKEGQLVTLNSSQEIIPYAGSGVILGIAGDTKSSSASALPGVATGWQNRVSDSFDETDASDLMTVYHGGGEFATDQFDADVLTGTVGAYLYGSSAGVLQAASSGTAVAVLVKAAGSYPSGVPGVDINGDIALGGENTNQYIEFKLLI
jgi:hypothetical protein